MKKVLLATATLIGLAGMNWANADEGQMHMGHHHETGVIDTRISLNVQPPMKQHQLSNMREHVEAIKSIVGLMSDSKFEEAAKIAHSKLGLTPDMQTMCGMFNNAEFVKLGMAFHKSGDELGDVLKTKDVNASLRALNKIMSYCVQCHATYRQ
jgi:hypothetical protein